MAWNQFWNQIQTNVRNTFNKDPFEELLAEQQPQQADPFEEILNESQQTPPIQVNQPPTVASDPFEQLLQESQHSQPQNQPVDPFESILQESQQEPPRETILREPTKPELKYWNRPTASPEKPSAQEYIKALPVVGETLNKAIQVVKTKGQNTQANEDLLGDLMLMHVTSRVAGPILQASRLLLRNIGYKVAKGLGKEGIAKAFGTTLQTDIVPIDLDKAVNKGIITELERKFYLKSVAKDILKEKYVSPLKTEVPGTPATTVPSSIQTPQTTALELYKPQKFTTPGTPGFDISVKAGVNAITQGKGLSPASSIERHLADTNKGVVKKIADLSAQYRDIHIRPERMLSAMDSWKDDGPMTTTVMNPLLEAEETEFTNIEKSNDVLKKISGKIKWNVIAQKKVNVGKFKKISKDALLDIYANSFEPANKADLIESGITEEDLKAVEQALEPSEKKLVQDTLKYLTNDLYPRLSMAYKENTGKDLGFVQNYYPLSKLDEASFGIDAIEMDVTRRSALTSTQTTPSALKHRTHAVKPIKDFSFISKIYKYITDAEHYIAYANPIKNADTYLKSPEIRMAIRENYGNHVNDILDKWLKDVSRGSSSTDEGIAGSIASWLRQNTMTSYLGYNVNTVLKQPASFFQGARELGEIDSIKSIFRFVKNPVKVIRDSNNRSVMIRNRSYNIDRDLSKMLHSEDANKIFGKMGLSTILKQELHRFILGADKMTVCMLHDGAYWKAKAQGKSDDEAIKLADKLIRRTQPMGATLHLPDLFRAGQLWKTYTTFKNQLNQNFNLEYESVSQLNQAKGFKKVKQTLSFSKDQLYYIFLPAAYLGYITRRRLPTIKEYGRDAAHQITGSLLILNALTTEWDSPSSLFESVTRETGKLGRTAFGKEKLTEKLPKLGAQGFKLGAIATGVPIVALQRLAEGRFFGSPVETSKQRKKAAKNRKNTMKLLKNVITGNF